MGDRLDQIDWSVTWFALQDNLEPMAWNLFLAVVPLLLSYRLFSRPKSWLERVIPGLLLVLTIAGSFPRFQALGQRLWSFLVSNPGLGIGGAIAFLSLGLWLYRLRQSPLLRSIFWWVGVGVFIAFLPNAAYILTDAVHLVIDIRKGYPMGTVLLFLIPQYLLFILTGFEAYSLSIVNLGRYLIAQGHGRLFPAVELGLHGLSAIGIYLGRFARFNSWDVLTNLGGLVGELRRMLFSPHVLQTIMVLFVVLTLFHELFKRLTIALMRPPASLEHHD
jgi:uncharacterized membrane protein